MDDNEWNVAVLANSPLQFDTFSAIAASYCPLTASELAWESRSALPNTMRGLKVLVRMKLVDIEQLGNRKHYSVNPRRKKAALELVARVLDCEVSPQFCPVVATHYAVILARYLSEIVPRGWIVSSGIGAKPSGGRFAIKHMGAGFAIEPHIIIHSSDAPLMISIDVCVGLPDERFFATISKAACFKSKNLAMHIVVLMRSPNSPAGDLINRLTERADAGWCQFALIHVKNNPKMGNIANEIIKTITEHFPNRETPPSSHRSGEHE